MRLHAQVVDALADASHQVLSDVRSVAVGLEPDPLGQVDDVGPWQQSKDQKEENEENLSWCEVVSGLLPELEIDEKEHHFLDEDFLLNWIPTKLKNRCEIEETDFFLLRQMLTSHRSKFNNSKMVKLQDI